MEQGVRPGLPANRSARWTLYCLSPRHGPLRLAPTGACSAPSRGYHDNGGTRAARLKPGRRFMTRPACRTSGNCTLPWPAGKDHNADSFIANCGRPVEPVDSRHRAEDGTFTVYNSRNKYEKDATEAGYFLLGFGCGCRGLFGLVVRQRRQRIGVVRDTGFPPSTCGTGGTPRRALVRTSPPLMRTCDFIGNRKVCPRCPGNRSPGRPRLCGWGSPPECLLRWSRRASPRASWGPLPTKPPVRCDNAELGILHHQAVLRADRDTWYENAMTGFLRSVPQWSHSKRASVPGSKISRNMLPNSPNDLLPPSARSPC